MKNVIIVFLSIFIIFSGSCSKPHNDTIQESVNVLTLTSPNRENSWKSLYQDIINNNKIAFNFNGIVETLEISFANEFPPDYDLSYTPVNIKLKIGDCETSCLNPVSAGVSWGIVDFDTNDAFIDIFVIITDPDLEKENSQKIDIFQYDGQEIKLYKSIYIGSESTYQKQTKTVLSTFNASVVYNSRGEIYYDGYYESMTLDYKSGFHIALDPDILIYYPDPVPTIDPESFPEKTKRTVDIPVNGVTLNCYVNDSGILQITPTEQQQYEIIESSNKENVVFELANVEGISGFLLKFEPGIFINESTEGSRYLTIKSFEGAELQISKENLAQIADYSGYDGNIVFIAKYSDFVSVNKPSSVTLSTILSNGKYLDGYGSVKPIRISLPCVVPDGYNESGITVSLMNDDKNTIIKRSIYSDGSVIALISAPGTYNVNFSQPIEFNDIKNKWMEEAVSYLSVRGVTNGRGNGEFAPDCGITRAEFITMFARLIDSVYSEHKHPDIFSPDDKIPEWALGAVTEQNMFAFYGGENLQYKANEIISRQEMFQIIYQYLLFWDMYYSEEEWIPYSDLEGTDERSQQAVRLLSQIGLLSEYKENIYPFRDATRAEAIQLLYNYLVWECR